MKKLLGAVFAAALLFPPGPASAEILKNLKVSGQLDVQADSARNIGDFATRGDNKGSAALCGAGVPCTNNDRIGDVTSRLLLNVGWDLLDDVHSMVTLRKNDRAWGTTGGLGQGAGAGNGGAGNQALIGAPGAGGGVAGNLILQQANVKIDKMGGYVDTTVGRQYYGDAGDLVIFYGPQDNYGLFVTAIDAARFDVSNDWVNFSGLAGKTAQAGAIFVGENATNVQGFDVGVKQLPVKTDVFVWNRVTQGTGALGTPPTAANGGVTGLNDFLWVYGLKVHGEAMGAWVTGTAAMNSGSDRTTLAAGGCGKFGCNASSSNYEGKALLVDAGWKGSIANIGGFTPWGNFGWGTGRSSNMEARNEGFTSIASDYRPGIINRVFGSGLAPLAVGGGAVGTGAGIGTIGLNNRVIWGVGLKFNPSMWEKLTVGGSVWDYRLQRNTGLIGGATAAGNRHLGTEIGFTADWKHSDNVTTGIGWATFQTGGFINNTNGALGGAGAANVGRGSSPATYAFADLTVKW